MQQGYKITSNETKKDVLERKTPQGLVLAKCLLARQSRAEIKESESSKQNVPPIVPWYFLFPFVFSRKNQGHFLDVSTVFSCVFFAQVLFGVERARTSLAFLVVFLGFYLNTKKWNIRS